MPPNNITYIYDDLGRLKAVVDPAGDTGMYALDEQLQSINLTAQG